jgi:hypothetical protein
MKSLLIAVVTCAVIFYIRFLWAIQDDWRQRRKNSTDNRQPSASGSLLKVGADVLALTRSNAAPARAKKF